MAELAEVLWPQPIQRRAVHLGRAADGVVDARLERLAVLVVPRFFRDIAVVDEHGLRVPVLLFAREPVAALEDEDSLARRRELPRERPATGTTADDDHVI